MKYSVNQAKQEIKNGIRAYLQKDADGNYLCDMIHRIPFYLEGMPGIGKTEIVRQTAEELGIGFVSFSITHHTRNSLLGLPVISEIECGKYTEYTMSEIIAEPMALAEKGQKEGILLLDEFNCASETIMPTMLAFLQTRNIGKYRLPDGWSIVLCGNPPEYNRNARSFDGVILDRVRKLNVMYELDDFIKYAAEKKINPVITKYLSVYRNHFYCCETKKNEMCMVTCRGWENLGYALQSYEMLEQKVTPELVFQYIKSKEIAMSFYDYYMLIRQSVDIKDVYEILKGKNIAEHIATIKEKGLEEQLKIVEIFGRVLDDCAMEEERDAIVSKKISNAIRFVSKLPEAELLNNQMFQTINGYENLLLILTNVKNLDYLKLCRKEYGISEAV